MDAEADDVEYVLLDIPSSPEYLFNEKRLVIQNLNTDAPSMVVGRKHLVGRHVPIMGTSLVFEIQHGQSPSNVAEPVVFGAIHKPPAKSPKRQKQSLEYLGAAVTKIVFE
ncbi:unnamed protein product (mitochondrion) [Plasmodiophora brassicae]|uniref:Transcription factor TFIIIC triple barrel domain-containing protein n=1 Tax=Plasmodiophora brassicae TaxID=37360 RepID=A0A0G4IRA3_PLABS|nr:hypothetical protein PBRA_005788 [Plasmodiophora brassicae]SPQ98220.1 unnamed protein product [Plasmodiophora brassicae]